jgi:hypothetical protein
LLYLRASQDGFRGHRRVGNSRLVAVLFRRSARGAIVALGGKCSPARRAGSFSRNSLLDIRGWGVFLRSRLQNVAGPFQILFGDQQSNTKWTCQLPQVARGLLGHMGSQALGFEQVLGHHGFQGRMERRESYQVIGHDDCPPDTGY